MSGRFSSRIWNTCIMKGTASSSSNHSATASSSTEGAKGRNDSRRLILALRISFMSARRGSQRIERLPSARGPHSMRPWNQPTTLPSAIAAAVRRQSSASSAMFFDRAARRGDARPLRAARSCVDLGRRELRAPIGVVHDERPSAAELVPDREGRADRAAGIAGRGLHVDAPERRHAAHLAVGDGIHRAAAGERDDRSSP